MMRKAKRKLMRLAAMTVLMLIQLAAAVIPAVITAMIVLPIAYNQRGYQAVGGEWLMILLVAGIGFMAANKLLFRALEREEAKRDVASGRGRKNLGNIRA